MVGGASVLLSQASRCDLFVEESRFDGKGFEMIDYINKHFNPSGAVNSLGYIFDLIDIKQGQDEPVVTLRARFLRVFASLKMGGVEIASSLQVGFMLRALLSRYSAVVTDFRLSRHLLTTATLQTVVEHCTAFDKDPWTGPVGRDGRPVQAPSASTARVGTSEPSAAYDAMEQVSFNYHLSRWRKSLLESSDKCVICHNLARGNKHSISKCPVLKKLGMRLEKRSAADQGPDSAARVASDSSCNPAATPSPASAPVPNSGSLSLAGTRTACTEAESYDSSEEFDYEGKYVGLFYAGATKSSSSSSLYLPASLMLSLFI